MIFQLHLPPLKRLAVGTLCLLAGCETGSGPARRPEAPPATTAAATATPAPAPSPEMEAHGLFFNGQIEAEVLLNRVGFAPRETAARDGAGGRGGTFRGGRGGGRRGGGGTGGGRTGEMPGGRDGPRAGEDGSRGPAIRAANEPPVRLHLRLTNHGTEAVDVEVPDFNSDLGNFVVQPRKLTLAPGASVEADPMTSRLGVKADEIALTVALRTGGRTEKQMLPLRIKPPASPATEPPAAAAPPP